MLELGLLTEDGWNVTAVTHGSYRWIIMLEKCFIPKMKPRKIEKNQDPQDLTAKQ